MKELINFFNKETNLWYAQVVDSYLYIPKGKGNAMLKISTDLPDGNYNHNLEPVGRQTFQPDCPDVFRRIKERGFWLPYTPFVECLLEALDSARGKRKIYIDSWGEEWDASLLRQIFKHFKSPLFAEGGDGKYHLKDGYNKAAEIVFMVKRR